MTGPLAIPFGDPRRLHNRKMISMPTRQDAAVVICGGGDPFAEAERALDLCAVAGRSTTVIVGNDMIGKWKGHVHHACTLHPDKLSMWTGERITNGLAPADHVWAHRPFSGVTDHTRDWSGSTGLFCVKVARELGFVHVLLCGVHMSRESNHFVRGVPWVHAENFLRGWEQNLDHLKPYVRSFGGWTREQLGLPDPVWLMDDIEDKHQQSAPPTYIAASLGGLKA